MSAWVTGQGTPSTGCHFSDGVLTCDSLLCLCMYVCMHTHGCHARKESDLRAFGERQMNRELSNFPVFVHLCHPFSPVSLILSGLIFFLNICSLHSLCLSRSLPAFSSSPSLSFSLSLSISLAELFNQHLPQPNKNCYRN